MNSKTVWGNHRTSRWEFGPESAPAPAPAPVESLATETPPVSETKIVNDINVFRRREGDDPNQCAWDDSNYDDSVVIPVDVFDQLLVLRAAALDLIDGNISDKDFKGVVEFTSEIIADAGLQVGS